MSRRRVVLWISVSVIVFCLFGSEAFRTLVSEWRETRHLRSILVNLRGEHERLNRELSLIQTDPSYTEFLIRKNLGYVKKGEVEYHFMREKKLTAHEEKAAPRIP